MASSYSSPTRPRRPRRPRSQSPRQRLARARSSTRQRPRVTTAPSTPRLVMVWAALMIMVALLVGRMAWLQLRQGESLGQMAAQQRVRPSQPQPLRYPIVDRQGNLLAMDRMVFTLYSHPKLFNQPSATVAEALSPLLEKPAAELLAQWGTQPTGIRVMNGLTAETADRIRQLRLNGLELVPQQQRFYPQEDLFAPVIGFVNFDGAAQAGLEIGQESHLLLPERDQSDPILALVQGQTGKATLHLTLDSRLQRVAQNALEDMVAQRSAKGGTILVMDVDTGAMLAMAVAPTYNPNEYYRANMGAFRNWAISDLYEPGSTFKPINVAIALEAGVLQPDELVNDSGQIQFGRWTIRNSDFAVTGGRGAISITDVMKYSSNVGMIRIMQKLTPEDYFQWLEKLGMDQPSGIDLPNEAVGQMKDREQFIRSRVEPATTSFGQGFSMTPIKMMQLQAAISNGGRLVIPHVVSGLKDSEGTLLWEPQRPPVRRVFSERTTQALMPMLEAVVDTGTGRAAQIPGYRVGGKTGTAQKALPSGGYGPGRITSFVGVLPIENPRYVVMAILDEPKGADAYGGTTAAPLVKAVSESLVVLEGIPPSDVTTPTP
ncbi:peptidoglycan D,D-transpeptidase FtsI family protein [Leptolyngbya sp. BL0902]|uniref:peptidoglycan D,D-transpeptidase FtsI family protein n=1 Tax=Leptolyngbya sp. BL0902 TaxID=1115757 RepID=UPI0018E7CC7E|nr:penicillin-binding protein 2 [Leptolyngbya sp. BL0902]